MLMSPEFRASQSSVSSKSRASLRPTWRLKRSSASGSVAQGLSRSTSVRIPICAHSFHANARSRSATSFLSAEICIFDPERRECVQQFLTEAGRRIVSDGPPGGIQQFGGRRIERAKILLMLAWPLICNRVKLEMDLVESTCKPDRERAAILAALQSRLEPHRQSEIEKAR